MSALGSFLVLACPMCAADVREQGVAVRSLMLGAMLLVPFLVVGFGVLHLRKVLKP